MKSVSADQIKRAPLFGRPRPPRPGPFPCYCTDLEQFPLFRFSIEIWSYQTFRHNSEVQLSKGIWRAETPGATRWPKIIVVSFISPRCPRSATFPKMINISSTKKYVDNYSTYFFSRRNIVRYCDLLISTIQGEPPGTLSYHRTWIFITWLRFRTRIETCAC